MIAIRPLSILLLLLSVSSCSSSSNIDDNNEYEIITSTIETGDNPVVYEISPIEISHSVDEVFKDGMLFEKYNYLRYVFEMEGLTVVATAYLDGSMSTKYFCPSNDEAPFKCVHATKFELSVLEYLKRRYHLIFRSDFEDIPQVVWGEVSQE